MRDEKYYYHSQLFTLGFIGEIHAQHVNWREYVEQLAEEEGMNEAAIENMYQALLQLENNPLI